MNTNYAFKFKELTFFVKYRIRTQIKSLKIISKKSLLINFPELLEENAKSLSYKDCTQRAFSNLNKDFNNNLIESHKNGWAFDYVVSNDCQNHSVVQILTRLYSLDPDKSGEILYGQSIVKFSNNKYLLWLE